MSSLAGAVTGPVPSGADSTISGAISQGFYVPVVKGEAKPTYLFSKQEAQDCLSNKKVFFAGDSYQTVRGQIACF